MCLYLFTDTAKVHKILIRKTTGGRGKSLGTVESATLFCKYQTVLKKKSGEG